MSDNSNVNLRKTIRLTPELVKKWDPKKVRQFLGNGKHVSDKVRPESKCEFFQGLIRHFIDLMIEKGVNGGNFTPEEKEYIKEVVKNEYRFW